MEAGGRKRMKLPQLRACLVGLSLVMAASGPAIAQQTTADDLKKEIDSLRTMLQAIQKDVQEMMAMLARQAPAPSGIGAVIDFGTSPVKGEQTAKLTLVEFSDYQ
jgi:protein-disulfide isomerase